MSLHDWARVDASTYHDFHTGWITHLKEALNGSLPQGYYAKAEQHVGRKVADVLALHASDPERLPEPPEPPEGASVAVAEAPPRVARTLTASPDAKGARRTLTVRHTSGHRVIALVEIVSPGNKGGERGVGEFVEKVVAALRSGLHVVLVDVLPPGRHDPQGMHAAVWEALDPEAYTLPAEAARTLASYAAGQRIDAYVDHPVVGEALKEMPLFLTSRRYVGLPLAASYDAAVRGMPGFWRDVLEGGLTSPGSG